MAATANPTPMTRVDFTIPQKPPKKKAKRPSKRKLGWVVVDSEGCVAERGLYPTRQVANHAMSQLYGANIWLKMKRQGWKVLKGAIQTIDQKTKFGGLVK